MEVEVPEVLSQELGQTALEIELLPLAVVGLEVIQGQLMLGIMVEILLFQV